MFKLAKPVNPAEGSEISTEQMDILDEFRVSLRESYALNRVEGQDGLLRDTVRACSRIIQEYPAGCRCSRPGAKGGLCRCCQRLGKAMEVVGTLETLSTKRFHEDAGLVKTFLTTFANLLADRDQPGGVDPVAANIVGKKAVSK